MRRLLLIGIFLLLAAPAAAKEIKNAEVCGADRCVPITDGSPDMVGGEQVVGPRRPEGFVRLKARFRGEGATETISIRFLPGAGLLLGDDGTWYAPNPTAVNALRDAAARVELRPARGIEEFVTAPPPERPAPASPAAPNTVAADDGGLDLGLLAVLALAALVVAAGIVGVRRRLAAAP
jgi:hypothetical protein